MVKNILENKKLIYAAYGVFFIYLAIFVFYLQFDAYWSVGDDFNYIETTARGIVRFAAMEGPRFYPMWGIENNLLLPFGRYFFPYMLLRVALLLGYLYIMYQIFRRYNLSLLLPVLMLLMINPKTMFEIYSPVFFQEAVILPLFGLFILQILNYNADHKPHRLLIALLCAVLCTYNKEIYFTLFAAYGTFMLLFPATAVKQERLFYYSLLLNAVVFLVLYYFMSLQYLGGGGVNLPLKHSIRVLINFLIHNPLFIVFLCIGAARLYLFIFKKDRRFLLADILLFMGVLLILGYSKLGLYNNRYTLPVYPLAFTSIAIYFSIYGQCPPPRVRGASCGCPYACVGESRKLSLFKIGFLFSCLILLGWHLILGAVTLEGEIKLWLKERRYSKTEVVFFSKLLDKGYAIKMNSRVPLYFERGIRGLVSLMYTGGDKFHKNLDAFGIFQTPSPEDISGKTIFLEVPYWVREQNFYTNEEHLHTLGLERVPNLPNINRQYFIINPIYALYSSPSNMAEIKQTGSETLHSLGLSMGDQ